MSSWTQVTTGSCVRRNTTGGVLHARAKALAADEIVLGSDTLRAHGVNQEVDLDAGGGLHGKAFSICVHLRLSAANVFKQVRFTASHPAGA